MKNFIIFAFLIFSFLFVNNHAAAAENNVPDLSRYAISESQYSDLKTLIDSNKNEYPYYILSLSPFSFSDFYSLETVNSSLSNGDLPKFILFSSEPFVFETQIVEGTSMRRVFFNYADTVKYKSYEWSSSFSSRSQVYPMNYSNSLLFQCASTDAWIYDLSNWICFTNMTLHDNAGTLEDFQAYTPTMFDEGKKYGQTDSDETEATTPEEETPGILQSLVSFVKVIPDKLNSLLNSMNSFFSDFGNALTNTLSDLFVPDWDDVAVTTIYQKLNSIIDDKYPFIGQVNTLVKKLVTMSSYDPFEKYVGTDGYYDDGGMRGYWFEQPDSFSFKMPASWSGKKNADKKYNLLNTRPDDGNGVILTEALKLANTIISCFLWVAFVWKMYKRLPTFIEPFKL